MTGVVEVFCDWPTKDQVREQHGQHVRVAQTLKGLYFAWTKYQQPGYQPRHVLPDGEPPTGTVVAYEGGFAMVVPPRGPWGDRQLVFPGPHTNYGQPCGGYGCNGMEPYCQDCEAEAHAHYEEERRAYYDAIGPLNVYPTWYEYDDHYTPGHFWPDERDTPRGL